MRMLSMESTVSGSRQTEVKKLVPIINISEDVRYPVHGATYQPRGGIAKHDWVAWGYAKAASDLGVDIIQGTEVTGFDIRNNKVQGVHTSQGNYCCRQGWACRSRSFLAAGQSRWIFNSHSKPALAGVGQSTAGTGTEYRSDEWGCPRICQPGAQG